MVPDMNTATEQGGAEKRWYVVHTYSGYEKRVQQSLREHIARKGMESLFDEILVPTEDVVEMKDGKKKTSERKFFPGYVMVRMHMNDETWHLVRRVPKVSGFVGGSGSQPAPVSDKEIDEIMQQMKEGAEKPRPKHLYAPGELVRVIDGPFQDFNGVVEDVNVEKSKLRVAISIFGRSTPVELEFSNVTKG